MARVDVPVLVYHRIGTPPSDSRHPDTYSPARSFARQLALLKALGYRTITAEEYAQSRLGIPVRLPGKPILITFDDGSSTVFTEALPAMKKHGFSAVVFMVASNMGLHAAWDGEEPGSGHRQLTADELRSLAKEGWTVGSHTVTHSRLAALDPQAVVEELTNSKRTLESTLGRPVDWFAYPYGDFDPGLREAVSRAGYRNAFATEQGDGHPFAIPRRIISGGAGLFKFLRRLYQARRLSRR